MGTLSPANEYPLSCKWLPSLLQMSTLSPANDYPLSCKWVPSLLQMTTLSPANGYPLSCKWLPSLLQMGTLSPANDYPLCCFSNAYPLCCKWVLSLQNITFRVVLRRSTANLFIFLGNLHFSVPFLKENISRLQKSKFKYPIQSGFFLSSRDPFPLVNIQRDLTHYETRWRLMYNTVFVPQGEMDLKAASRINCRLRNPDCMFQSYWEKDPIMTRILRQFLS